MTRHMPVKLPVACGLGTRSKKPLPPSALRPIQKKGIQIRLTRIHPSTHPKRSHALYGSAPTAFHHALECVVVQPTPLWNPLLLNHTAPFFSHHQITRPMRHQFTLQAQNAVYAGMTLKHHIPRPFRYIRNIFWRIRHQPVAGSKQFRKPGLPQTVNSILARQLTIVIEGCVQRHMGIRNIMALSFSMNARVRRLYVHWMFHGKTP